MPGLRGDRSSPGRLALERADEEGELYASPSWLSLVWLVLVVLTCLEALNEIFGIGGPSSLYETWFHDAVLAAASALILARAAYEPKARRAWLAFGLAMTSWCVGSIAWSIVYGSQASPPYPTFADILWLLWYPLMFVGIANLIQIRVRNFELHRWMDGIAVVLVVLVAGFAFIVQPVAEQSHQGALATVVDFSYPVLDVVLIGTILGVYGLVGWRPDRMWLLIGLGTLMTTIADAAFAVQEARGVADDNHYAFVWTLGALFLAYAAWVRVPANRRQVERVTGLRAVALPLLAQALAAGVTISAFFRPENESQEAVTLLVLLVASVQIFLTRPRAEPTGGGGDASTVPEGDVVAGGVSTAERGVAVSGSGGDEAGDRPLPG
jgi:hypothetical protein